MGRRKLDFYPIIDCEFIEGYAVMGVLPGYALSMFVECIGLNPSKYLPRNPSATCILLYRRGEDIVQGHAVLCDDYKNLSLDDFRYILSVASNSK